MSANGDLADELESLRATDGLERYAILERIRDRGPDATETLSSIRRYGPGTVRLPALTALTFIGGEPVLDHRDMRALERLIRIKQLTEVPVGIDASWNSWICVPGDDQHGIMEILGLAVHRPSTFALAGDVIEQVAYDVRDNLVFVSPQINEWTAVIGPWCNPIREDRADEIQKLVERLSEVYGRAHAFYFASQNDGSAWLVAEGGRTVRRYSDGSPAMAIGDPLPVEQEYLDQFGITGKPEDHFDSEDEEVWEFHDECTAQRVAAAISLDTVWDMPRGASVVGRGCLASTPASTGTGIGPGVYRI